MRDDRHDKVEKNKGRDEGVILRRELKEKEKRTDEMSTGPPEIWVLFKMTLAPSLLFHP